MTALKAIIDVTNISFKNLLLAIITLILFGVATDGLFELWKLIPTLFMEGSIEPDWYHISLYTSPFLIFLIWITAFYLKYISRKKAKPSMKSEAVATHRGIVLSLSAPKKSYEEIIENVKTVNVDKIDDLFNEWSIGQLFKGIYHHKENLRYIWLLTTNKSIDYVACIEVFINRFVPSAGIHGKTGKKNKYHITSENDIEVIEQTKALLADIYSKDNLETLGLSSSDIIVDITGGHKPITIGMTFGALDSAIDIQYVEQNNYMVIPLDVTPEIILDKTGEYLLQLYSRINEMKKSLRDEQYSRT